MTIKNQTQLITYPDSLGGDLRTLHLLLGEHFSDIFLGGVHILPPFLSSGDRGFAPITYYDIDPKFGSWDQLHSIGKHLVIILDLMVNHISRQSHYFQDFVQKGRTSEFAGLFLTLDKVWPGGIPRQGDIEKIFLRRPKHPFADIQIQETGERERVWATFGTRDWSEQIDLDVNSPETRKYFVDILKHMSEQGIKILRLDAIAFVIKKPGTSCFFVEPEIYAFLDWIKREADKVGLDLLPEVHAHYSIQNKLAAHGSWVYNFVLPFLILHTLFNRTSLALQEHLKACPRKQFTMLDCHDGIPVQPDLDDILDIDEIRKVVEICRQRGANLSRIFSSEHTQRPGFDAHQVNITYYSALNSNDNAYLTARAIQFFTPGVPQVYYVGLLGGENESGEVERTGEKRAINRKNYTVNEVLKALQKPVVQRLLRLIRFRNEYEAFNGEFEVLKSNDRQIRLSWQKGEKRCELLVNLDTQRSVIDYRDMNGDLKRFTP